MFAIAFDLIVADAQQHHPRGYRQAYLDAASTLRKFGFERVQRSVFASREDDLANLLRAVMALRELGWFGRSVRNVRPFRMAMGSDLTAVVKGQ
jgi:virulence-associated protein VapD